MFELHLQGLNWKPYNCGGRFDSNTFHLGPLSWFLLFWKLPRICFYYWCFSIFKLFLFGFHWLEYFHQSLNHKSEVFTGSYFRETFIFVPWLAFLIVRFFPKDAYNIDLSRCSNSNVSHSLQASFLPSRSQSKASHWERIIRSKKLLWTLFQSTARMKKFLKCAIGILTFRFSNSFVSIFIGLFPSVKVSIEKLILAKTLFFEKLSTQISVHRNLSSAKIPEIFDFVLPRYSNS